PRERRPAEPVRGAPDVHGHHRVRQRTGVPEGRDGGGAVHQDRGEGRAAGAGRGHGPVEETAVTDPRPVLVLDFGAQYAHLIARRVREAHVYSEIVPFDISAADLEARRPGGLILSGG